MVVEHVKGRRLGVVESGQIRARLGRRFESGIAAEGCEEFELCTHDGSRLGNKDRGRYLRE